MESGVAAEATVQRERGSMEAVQPADVVWFWLEQKTLDGECSPICIDLVLG
jgi:hypothetical protein